MPAELVNRLARMFQDVKVSQDLTREFQEKSTNNTIEVPSVVVNIKILSSGTWLPRSLPKLAVVLPSELEDFIPQVSLAAFYQLFSMKSIGTSEESLVVRVIQGYQHDL